MLALINSILQNFEKEYTGEGKLPDPFNWRVVLKAKSTDFHTGNRDDTVVKPVVELTDLSYSPKNSDSKHRDYPFRLLVTHLLKDIKAHWDNKVK